MQIRNEWPALATRPLGRRHDDAPRLDGCLAFGVARSGHASAQNYPDHAGEDRRADRAVGQLRHARAGSSPINSAKRLKQSFVVENRPGRRHHRRHQGGRSRPTPDGYTLLVGGLSNIVFNAGPLQEPALRSAEGPRAGRARSSTFPTRWSARPDVAVQDAEGNHRGGQGQSRAASSSPTPASAPASMWSARRSRRSPARKCWRCRIADRRWRFPICSSAASICSSIRRRRRCPT